MRILTDCREQLNGFLPSTIVWSGPVQLEAAEARLWEAAGGLGTPQAARHDSRRGLWETLVVVADAPRSQFDSLRDLMSAGVEIPGPAACLALTGSGFHGQRGRTWAVSEGNVHLTACVRPNALEHRVFPGLVMLPTVAVCDAIGVNSPAGPKPRIKWVNDVLLDDAKVAGSLVATHSRVGLVESAVIGIGVNVAHAPDVPRTTFVPAVTCLGATNPSLNWRPFAWTLLASLGQRWTRLLDNGSSELLEAYRALSAIVGRPVRVWDEASDGMPTESATKAPDLIAEGIVEGIEPNLGLRIRGRAQLVTTGRLELL